MKVLRLIGLILVGQLVLSHTASAAITSAATESATTESATTADIFSKAKNSYVERIESQPPVGSVDQDFAGFLLPQHFSGVELSRIELSQGHNPTLRNIAAGIVAHSDRSQPVTTKANPNVSPTVAHAATKALATADSQAREVFQAPSTSSIDKEFARLMDAHHLRAIAYAQAEIDYGKDSHLIKMAHSILENQIKQHDVMVPLTR